MGTAQGCRRSLQARRGRSVTGCLHHFVARRRQGYASLKALVAQRTESCRGLQMTGVGLARLLGSVTMLRICPTLMWAQRTRFRPSVIRRPRSSMDQSGGFRRLRLRVRIAPWTPMPSSRPRSPTGLRIARPGESHDREPAARPAQVPLGASAPPESGVGRDDGSETR